MCSGDIAISLFAYTYDITLATSVNTGSGIFSGSMRSAGRRGGRLPLVPRAGGKAPGGVGRELLRPHDNELPILPLEHVVLHARIGVLAGLVEFHAPAVDPGADRQG